MNNSIKILIASLLFIFPLASSAATLFLSPDKGEYGPGDSFAVDIMIDTARCINTIEATIRFPNDYLTVIDFLTGESILHLWVDRPNKESLKDINELGEIYFAGGIPGGYCGKIPGDPGISNVVARVIFKIPSMIFSDVKRDKVNITFNSSNTRVLVNDGLGTEDDLELKNASFAVASHSVKPDQSWKYRIELDKIPPEPFVIELHQNTDIFEGKYYIIFNTTDKQSGLDRYEIKEIGPDELLGIELKPKFYEKWFKEETPKAEWIAAKMPYQLNDQSLMSVIKVKAVDKAGNERIVEYIPPKEFQKLKTESFLSLDFMLLLVIAFILIVGIIFVVIIKKRRTKKYYEEE
ncbi:cohesin domain-containing protein [bacterium]|nr:cohesin domain-containing protein [bacterium]